VAEALQNVITLWAADVARERHDEVLAGDGIRRFVVGGEDQHPGMPVAHEQRFQYARPVDEPRPRVMRAGTVPASGIASDPTAMVMTMTSWIRDRSFRFRNELEVVGHRVRGSTWRLSSTPRGTAPRDDGLA